MTEKNVIIVSNRLPVTVSKDENNRLTSNPSSGGLVSGLREVHNHSNSYWIGHCGAFPSDSGYQALKENLKEQRLLAVDIKRKTYNSYYNGLANDTLWPLFHYFPDAMEIDFNEWRAYKEANQIFADAILEVCKPGDFIWVHDYQLMLLPNLLRQANKDLHIAYFHHIPFPSSELFRLLPMRKSLLTGLLGADLIGFHTYDYVRHFLSSVTRLIGLDSHVDEVYFEDRFVKVGAYPLGVDAGIIEKAKGPIEDSKSFQEYARNISDKVLFLGIDRLDYSKGILERLEAFRTFLGQNPQYVGKATLLQICVPSRTDIATYGNLRSAVEKAVSRINGEFGSPGYTAVQYMFQSFSSEEILSLYKLADVCVVTPLRDGLNLVCKEYVAARTDEEGVLILSEFAGSAAEMGEALIVNPRDTRGVAEAMFKALTMSREERQYRMKLLRKRILDNNNKVWAKTFIEAWRSLSESNTVSSRRLLGDERSALVDQIVSSERSFVFLDYDGTLTPIVSRPELAVPSEALIARLRRLGEIPELYTAIVTGRKKEFCDQYFTDLPISIVAEHGAHIWTHDSKEWHSQAMFEEFNELKPEIMKLLELYTRNLPGSHIEEKDLSIVWHYRQAEPVFAKSLAMELSEALVQLTMKTSYSVFHGKKNLDIRPVAANKGRAVEYVLSMEEWQKEQPFLTFGDDKTDEDMHRVHSEHNVAIHVGRPSTFAKYYLDDPQDVAKFIDSILNAYDKKNK